MPKWVWSLLVALLYLPGTLAEEPPRSLVIVPWKSSEIGDDVSLTDTLDDRALPVDKEVFLRELRFYAIRSKKEQE